MNTPRPSFALSHARHGRLLVECLVACLLLSVSALVVVALVRGSAISVQTAGLTSEAWAMSSQSIEAAVADRCPTGAMSGVDVRPRVVVEWSDRQYVNWRSREVEATLLPSPLAGAVSKRVRLRAARSCR